MKNQPPASALDQIEKVLQSEKVYSGTFLKIQKDLVICADGKERAREYILHPGAALIVAELANGELLIEKQYRHAMKQFFYEFPAGKKDADEDSLKTAQRELHEETGYSADEWIFLGVVHPCIGYANEEIAIYGAKKLHQGQKHLDAGETLTVMTMRPEEIHTQIQRGQITDAKTICAFYLWLSSRHVEKKT